MCFIAAISPINVFPLAVGVHISTLLVSNSPACIALCCDGRKAVMPSFLRTSCNLSGRSGCILELGNVQLKSFTDGKRF